MKVGYVSSKYPEIRNIIGKVEDVDYIYDKNNNWFSLKNKINSQLKIFGRAHKGVRNTFNHRSIFRRKDIDLYHFFNLVSSSDVIYITSFESFVPRRDEFFFSYLTSNSHDHLKEELLQMELSVLTSDNCKKIVSLSENAKKIQVNLLEKSNLEKQREVQNKIVVIHPPQSLIVESYEEKSVDELVIKFIFIGRHFFRKGGYEVTRAFDEICNKEPNIKAELILVGDIEAYEDNTKPVTRQEIDEIKQIIQKNNRIIHYKELSHIEIVNLLQKSHVGLLPSWSDTYGYSVLEMQAAGVPVITTNIRALPEINSEEVGWMINLPLSNTGEAEYVGVEARSFIRKKLINDLENIIESIVVDRDVIKEKGIKCLERIREEHCPVKYGKQMKKLYLESLD